MCLLTGPEPEPDGERDRALREGDADMMKVDG